MDDFMTMYDYITYSCMTTGVHIVVNYKHISELIPSILKSKIFVTTEVLIVLIYKCA